MLNKVILIGRLCADPIFKMTPNTGTPVTTFTLAVDRMDKDKSADFINIIVWNKQAELCAQYLGKGRLAAVVGRLQIRNYEKDGRKVYVSEVVAETVRFLDRASVDSDPVSEAKQMFGGETVDSEDVPF